MSNLKKRIPIQVYECYVDFLLTSDIIKEYAKLRKRYKYEDDDEGLAGVFIKKGDMKKYHLLISQTALTHNCISHEVFHAVSQICSERGIEEEETRAWLAGYLSAEIYKFLDRKKQSIKHG